MSTVSSYLGNFFCSKEVEICQIDGVSARDDGQSFGQMMTVGKIHVEDITNFLVLWK